MSVGLIYLIVAILAVALAGIAFYVNRGQGGKTFVAFTLMEIVIMAIIGVINGVLGTPNAMLGRLFMTFSGGYGFLAFAAICGGFYVSGPLCGYIIRKPGAATLAETMNGVAQVLSGNPNGVMVLGAGFLQGFMSDLGFAFYRLPQMDAAVHRPFRRAGSAAAADPGSLFLRRRRHGDRLQPAGAGHPHGQRRRLRHRPGQADRPWPRQGGRAERHRRRRGTGDAGQARDDRTGAPRRNTVALGNDAPRVRYPPRPRRTRRDVRASTAPSRR